MKLFLSVLYPLPSVSKTYHIYRCKEIWPIKIAVNYLGTNLFYNKTVIDKDLQVFIPNTEIIEESIKQFVEMYSLRSRKSREYWLVDIGYWTANVDRKQGGSGAGRTSFYERINHDLINLHVDLDDDLYFFEGKTILEYGYDSFLSILSFICRKGEICTYLGILWYKRISSEKDIILGIMEP